MLHTVGRIVGFGAMIGAEMGVLVDSFDGSTDSMKGAEDGVTAATPVLPKPLVPRRVSDRVATDVGVGLAM
jgi:hypothetical protein